MRNIKYFRLSLRHHRQSNIWESFCFNDETRITMERNEQECEITRNGECATRWLQSIFHLTADLLQHNQNVSYSYILLDVGAKGKYSTLSLHSYPMLIFLYPLFPPFSLFLALFFLSIASISLAPSTNMPFAMNVDFDPRRHVTRTVS